MAFLDDVKTELRVNGTAHNAEVQTLIDAAKADLAEAGILTVSESDALTAIAIKFYCKGHFGYDNPEAPRFLQNYESLKAHMASARKYNAYKVIFTVASGAGAKLKNAYITIGDADTVLVTNSQGVAEYYVYKIQDIDYEVYCAGYTNVSSSVYVSADTAVPVVMT